MKPRPLALLICGLFAAVAQNCAADGLSWSGTAGIGYRETRETAQDGSKLHEYRDLDSGALGLFDLRGRSDGYYINAFGENLLRDDQYLDLWGGKYGEFKYRLYGNWLTHNFGSGVGARSPYSGIGGATLTAVPAFPRLNTSNWNTYDNSYDRQDVGAMFEWQKSSPWYFRTEGNEVRRSGIKNISAAQGTSPGNGFVELPSPVDYVTRNFSVEGGYQTKEQHWSANWMHSKFTNDNPILRWSNGFFAPTAPTNYDTSILPADNEFWKIGLNGILKQLPWQSTLAMRVSYGKLTNDVAVQPSMLSGTGVGAGTNPATNPDSPVFHGEVVTKTASASFTSRPVDKVDTRLYWNWSRKDNNSTEMVFRPVAGSGLLSGTAGVNCGGNAGVAIPCTTELFNYRKNNFGAEAGWRFMPENKLSVGYDFWDVDRERIDFNRNIDNRYYIEWKNTSLETLSSRLKYQYMTRRSNFIDTAEANPYDLFVRRFDLANVDQNSAKWVLDWSPRPLIDVGFEAIYKKNDYKDTILGRTDDERQEYYATLSFGDPKSFRVTFFGDIEFVEFNSVHRNNSNDLADAGPFAPPGGRTGGFDTIYNWGAKNKDRSWQIGAGTDWVPSERWKVGASLIYAETRGTTDFSALPSGGGAPLVDLRNFLPIGNNDNTRRTSVNLKATYRVDRHWNLTGGYAFERYRYSDAGYANFQYIAGTGASASYLTGQSAFQDYTANIFYGLATYRF